MSIGDGRQGPHPDLLQAICDSTNATFLSEDVPEDHRLASPVQPEDIVIRGQRTWYDIGPIAQKFPWTAMSACIGQFDNGGHPNVFTVIAARKADTSEWVIARSGGGRRTEETRDQLGEFSLQGGVFVCVGGLGVVPPGGTLRVEHEDGSEFEDTPDDAGYCVVLAPVMSEPGPHDHATVTFMDADGTGLHRDRVWLGDGGPPPDPRYLTGEQ